MVAAATAVRAKIEQLRLRRVVFAPHNLLSDPPFSRIDLISCRNLLIYLNRDAQRRVFEIFQFALLPHGCLFLGSSESADAAAEFFVPYDKRNRIYRYSPFLDLFTSEDRPPTSLPEEVTQ